MEPSTPIFHVLPGDEWQTAQRQGRYSGSTRGSTVDEVGYVHCCFAGQVDTVARRLYAGTADLVVLVIDCGRLTSEVRVERLAGATDEFPHLYGPLDLAAVVDALPLAEWKRGRRY